MSRLRYRANVSRKLSRRTARLNPYKQMARDLRTAEAIEHKERRRFEISAAALAEQRKETQLIIEQRARPRWCREPYCWNDALENSPYCIFHNA